MFLRLVKWFGRVGKKNERTLMKKNKNGPILLMKQKKGEKSLGSGVSYKKNGDAKDFLGVRCGFGQC